MAVSLPAQKKTDVLMKFSEQEGLIRIVFEGDESFINKSEVATSSSQIKIEFPEPFNLTAQNAFPFELVPGEKIVKVNLKEKGEIKFFRLSSPARLVFDIQKKEMQSEKQPDTIISRVLVIDAGHGGYDFGITSGELGEKDINLSLAKGLATALSKKDKKVFLIRKVDQYISLADRIYFVNLKNPDIFISLHSSLSQNFVLYSPKLEEHGSNELADLYSFSMRQKKYIGKSKALSDSLGKAIKDEFKVDVIQREMPLPLLNSVGAPSVLIELPSQRFVVYDQRMREGIINSIINGIALYGL